MARRKPYISYRAAVEWIAHNDEPDDVDPDNIAGYISTTLVADLFGKPQEDVGADVASYRVKVMGAEGIELPTGEVV